MMEVLQNYFEKLQHSHLVKCLNIQEVWSKTVVVMCESCNFFR
jgi:hypothetical protein